MRKINEKDGPEINTSSFVPPLIKGLFNPFVIITFSSHRIYRTSLAPGVYDYRMQIGNIHTLLIMQCADVHITCTLLALFALFPFRRLAPVSPSLLDSLQREPPSL